MEAFTSVTGTAVPLDRSNVDTDAIIPKQYLKSIKRTGFGPYLFDGWRYLDPGDLQTDVASRRPNPNFELNKPEHAGAAILLARENFGCGSSREHAVWALANYGFRAVVASSYADIFYSNSFKNGFLPVILKPEEVEQLFQAVTANAACALTIDLSEQQLRVEGGETFHFEVDALRKNKLLQGLDEIGETLQHADVIRAYEQRRRAEAPWMFAA